MLWVNAIRSNIAQDERGFRVLTGRNIAHNSNVELRGVNILWPYHSS